MPALLAIHLATLVNRSYLFVPSEVTELLLSAGADISATDAKGRTALSYARERGRTRILEVLRAHGAA